MKPYQLIKNASKVTDQLTRELHNSTNKKRDAERINTIIRALNGFDSMLVSNYYTNAIESLIYALIYEYLMMDKAYKNDIPLHSITKRIENAIFYTESKKFECISILKQHELKNKIANETVFDKNYCNFDEMLTELVNDFKKSVKWNTKK